MTSNISLSPQGAKFQAWLAGGVVLKEKGDHLVLSVEEAKRRLAEAASSKSWDLVRDISTQLDVPIEFRPERIVSKSFRLSLPAFAKLAFNALESDSTASRLLRQTLLVETVSSMPDPKKVPEEKVAMIKMAVGNTAELQEADTSAYSRSEYRLPAVLFQEDPAKIAGTLWEELMSQVPQETSEKLELIKDSFVDVWTDFLREYGELDFVFRKNEDSVRLEFEADGLSFEMEEDELEQIGADVSELDNALGPFMVSGKSVLEEDCRIGLRILSWKVGVRQGRVYLDDFPLEGERIQKLKQSILSRDSNNPSILEKQLETAFSKSDFKAVAELSAELARTTRRTSLYSLAHEKLLDLLDGKPAVVSFTASEPLFGLWSLGGKTIEMLIADIGEKQ